jgi:hypothetical protein
MEPYASRAHGQGMMLVIALPRNDRRPVQVSEPATGVPEGFGDLSHHGLSLSVTGLLARPPKKPGSGTTNGDPVISLRALFLLDYISGMAKRDNFHSWPRPARFNADARGVAHLVRHGFDGVFDARLMDECYAKVAGPPGRCLARSFVPLLVRRCVRVEAARPAPIWVVRGGVGTPRRNRSRLAGGPMIARRMLTGIDHAMRGALTVTPGEVEPVLGHADVPAKGEGRSAESVIGAVGKLEHLLIQRRGGDPLR